jgi:ribosome maturation factor RimP
MPDLPRHTGIEARLAALVMPTLADLGYELVRIAVLGREKPTVQIMADRANGAAFTVDDCEQISHAVGAVLDVENPLPAQWTLEVSSAGIDRPLTRIKDWNNHMGHLARVELEQPVDGRRRLNGVILGADPQQAQIRLDDGTIFSVPLDLVRRAKLVLTDALIEATTGEPAPAYEPPGKPAPRKTAGKPKSADNAKRKRAN